MKNTFIHLTTFLVSLFLSSSSFAAPVAVDAGDVDPNNFLISLTSGGTTYTQSSLILGELTAFSGATNSNLLVNNGTGAPGTGAPRLNLLGGDFDLDTGIINQGVGNNTATYQFDAPIMNLAGPDIFLFEIATTRSVVDSFDVLINGIEVRIDGGDSGDYGFAITTTNSSDIFTVNGGTSNITELLNNNVSSASTDISQGVYGVGLDLSDFGIADFATITSLQYGSAGSSTGDPVLIVGVPEPSTYALLALASIAGFVFYRRKQLQPQA